MIDFGVLPPEINSARMYSGAGAGPLLSAANAWSELAASLESSAAETRALTSGLDSAWQGPSAEDMNAKMASYVSWLTSQAATAQSTGIQAQAAAAAYGEAFAATVPPISVIANRTELTTLVATNILGQNTPAIMANEAEYSEMWAQDAATMYSYATTSAQATTLTPFSSPTTGTTPVSAATSGATTTTSISSILAQLLSQISLDPINDVTNVGLLSVGFIAAFIQGVPAMLAVSNGANGGGGYNPAVAVPNPAPRNIINLPAEEPAVPVVPRPGGGIGGRLGAGERIGALSVPPSWANATANAEAPEAAPFVPYGGGEPGAPMVGMPMGAGGAKADAGERRQQPRYGVKPKVMPDVRI